ncbi:hypothetical protein EPN87_00905 [archaeon]|nr:MAG: hypothetical protein EPN87_00905 [archaeon]
MNSSVKVLLLQTAILAVVSTLFYFLVGPRLAVIFVLIWVDKALIPLLRFAGYFGFEMATLPAILIGMSYGPMFGFLFSTVAVAIIGGILNIISWRIVSPLDIGWPPLLPSPDHFIDGIVSVIAGILPRTFPFILVVLICVLVKNAMAAVKQQGMEGYVNYLDRGMNVGVNLIVAWLYQGAFLYILSL